MRALLASAIGCLAVVVGASSPAPAHPAAPDVSYLFHAQFDLDYDVDWVETGGDRLDDCAPWWDNRGSTSLSAASLEWIPGQLRMTPGRTAATLSTWSLTATGARPHRGRVPPNARVEVTRRLVQRGGPIAGCSGQTPFRAPENDCGAVSYKTRAGTLFAGFLKGVETLEALLSEGRHLGIRVTASPPRKLFRTCLTTAHAPEVPLNFPVTLKRSNLQALLRLREDETHTISRDFAGHCKAGLGATSSCHYDLHMTVKIRRWVSRKRCGTRWCPNRFP